MYLLHLQKVGESYAILPLVEEENHAERGEGFCLW